MNSVEQGKVGHDLFCNGIGDEGCLHVLAILTHVKVTMTEGAKGAKTNSFALA